MSKLTVVGSINADLIVHAERHPQPGETLLGSGGDILAGGKGANQAVAAAQLGADVALWARSAPIPMPSLPCTTCAPPASIWPPWNRPIPIPASPLSPSRPTARTPSSSPRCQRTCRRPLCLLSRLHHRRCRCSPPPGRNPRLRFPGRGRGSPGPRGGQPRARGQGRPRLASAGRSPTSQ